MPTYTTRMPKLAHPGQAAIGIHVSDDVTSVNHRNPSQYWVQSGYT